MQEIEIIRQDIDCTIALCPIISDDISDRYTDFYTQDFKSVKRKKEWLTTHFILENIFLNKTTYSYNNLEKPVLVNRTENISISHSSNYAIIIASQNKKVVIDVEEITPRIHKIAHKFLNKSEKDFLEIENNKTEMLYLIWCAKEAIYKLSEVFLDFADQIIIENFKITDEKILKATVLLPDNIKTIELQYLINDKFVVVWVVES